MDPLFQIKICGITSPNDASMVCQAGADAIGINFYSASPRFVDTESAQPIVEAIDCFNSHANRHAQKVGVFVNSTVEEIILTAKLFRLDAIQLHGDEAPQMARDIRIQEKALEWEPRLIRAIRQSTQNESDNLTWIEQEIRSWSEAGCDAVLLDAAIPGEYGGTGKVIDWKLVAALQSPIPLILAGGLRADNVASAIGLSHAKAVDVASGVEDRPGVKDAAKVTAFIQSARSAWSTT